MSNYNITKSEDEWRKELTEEQYRILRKKGTEMPHTGKYNLHFKNGAYACAACHQQLFESESKFESNCGWPSFDEAIPGSVTNILDKSHGMIRTEVVCSNCGGHLGHVFNDGPTETGTRFCINSASVDFKNE